MTASQPHSQPRCQFCNDRGTVVALDNHADWDVLREQTPPPLLLCAVCYRASGIEARLVEQSSAPCPCQNPACHCPCGCTVVHAPGLSVCAPCREGFHALATASRAVPA